MFGADGHERIVKTLKQQIADRDGRLSVLTHENRLKKDELSDALKASDTLRQRAEREETRADRAEAARKEATNDLAQAKLDVGNLEAQLRAQTETRAALEKEVKRLEYELHSSASSSGPGPSTQEAKLAARVKALEQELARRESELRHAQANASVGAWSQLTLTPQLSSSNGGAPRKSKGRRRSSSFGGELSSLTTQRDVAAEAATSAHKELDVLRDKLRNADRERDKAVNEHMALQKRSAKELEALQDRVDELQYEVDALSGGPSAQRKDVEKDKLKADLKDALARVETLEQSITANDAEIMRLGEAEQVAASAGDAGLVVELRDKLAQLEAELEGVRTSAPRSSAQSQRELNTALRRIEAKEREIADLKLDLQEANDENASLREHSGALPNGLSGDGDGAEKVAELEKQLEDERAAAKAKLQEIQSTLDARSAEVDAARGQLEDERGAMAALRDELDALSVKAAAAAELESAVTAAQTRTTELEAEVSSHAAKIAELEQTLATSGEKLALAQTERDNLRTSLEEKESLIAQRQSKLDELEQQREQFGADADALNDLREQLAEKDRTVASLESKTASLAAELENARGETVRQREMANTFQSDLMEQEQQFHGELDKLRADLESLQAKLDEAGAANRDKDDKLRVATECLARAVSDNAASLQRIKELETQVMHRSVPDSDKDKRLGQLKDKIDHLHAQLQEKELLLDTAPEEPSTSAQMAQIDTMTVTIMRLRSERDEYKGQLRFVEQELGFAYDAAKKKEAVAEELRVAISQLEEKTALLSSLTDEKAALQGRVDELQDEVAGREDVVAERDEIQGRLDGVETERDELKTRLAHVEAERDTAATQVAELRAQLGAATTSDHDELQSPLTAVEAGRDTATARVAELETQVVSLQFELDASTKALCVKEAHAGELAEEEELRREAEDRAERAATLSAPADDEESKRQITQLFERVERRDKHIKNLEADKNKLHLNLTVAQEDAQEAIGELEALKATHAEVVESGARTAGELEAARAELESVQARAEALEKDVAKFEGVQVELNALNALHDELKTERDGLVATHAEATTRSAELDERHASLLSELDAVRAQAEERQERVAALEAELDAATALAASTEVESLVLALAVHRDAVAKAEAKAERASADLAAAVAKVAILEQEQGTLLQQGSEMSTLRDELETTHEALSAAEAKAATLERVQAELSMADSRRAELEKCLTEVEAQLAESSTTRSGLEKRLATLEKDLAAAQTSLESAKTEHAAALEGMEQQLEEITTEAEQQISATNDRFAKAAAAHDAALSAARTKAAAELEAANDRLATAESDVEMLSERVNALTSDRVKARSELNTERARADQAEQTVVALREEKSRIEQELATASESAKAASARIDDLVGELSMAKAEQSALVSELDGAHADLDTLQAKVADLSAALDAATAALETERQASVTAQARVTAAEAETKKASSHFNFMERQQVDLSARLAALRDELSEAHAKAKDLPAKEDELARLAQANETLKAELRDLAEDMKGKIAMLDAKNMDLEEADDREMELKKQIKKLGARADKLARKNKALESEVETLQNTMENMSPAKPARVAALSARSSPAVEAGRTRSSPPPGPAPKADDAPRASFNVFAAAGGTPRAKRGREDDDVVSAPTAETWVLAPTKISSGGKSPAVSSARKPLSALASRGDNERPPALASAARPKRTKPMSSTERVFMEKRAQLAATTPSDRKLLSGGATPGTLDKRLLSSGGTTPGGAHKFLSSSGGGVRNVFAMTPGAPAPGPPSTDATPRERPNVFAMGMAPP